jgi:hypothetical protein
MPYKPAPSKPISLTYVGALPGVVVSACGTYCPRGMPVEIPADVAEGLLEQATWEPAKKQTTTTPPEGGRRD